MTRDQILAWVKAERLSLADFLETLDDREWTVRSLCPEWTVKDVRVVRLGLRCSGR